MNIDALRTELTTDPLGIGYSGMDDAAAAASLNTVNRNYNVPIGSRALLAWAMANERLENIDGATSTGAPAIRAIAKGVQYLLNRADTEIDMDLAEHIALIDGLVAGGVLVAADKTELETMAAQQRSRAAELGLREVKPGHVQKARA